MDDLNEQRLLSIFREIFDDPDLQISRSTTASDVENWDSLTHINLIVAIEREFKIKLTTSEVAKLQNVGDLMQLIEHKTSSAR